MNIDEKVNEILRDLSGLEDVCEAHFLKTDLALDSLAMVTLLIQLEEVFEFELNESDMNPFALNTVKDVMCLAKKYMENKDV